ncbi:MAG: transposase [Methanococcoides sp.]|nr:transposase [Methanococcoides sp.]
MPRANRHYIAGVVWHITHRCHKKEFLLKFARDRQHWLRWLFEAKKRFGIRILNYAVTSNHIHLLVQDDRGREVLPKTMQLTAGRTAQEYNRRKNRKGAFWEDRYHATAVQDDDHLIRCMVYIDLNMVRAGVVQHPSEWPFSGYNEIQDPPQRYALVDQGRLMELLGFDDSERFTEAYKGWAEEVLEGDGHARDAKWSESIAVGSKSFVEEIREKLGIRAIGRGVVKTEAGYELKEQLSPYSRNFDGKMGVVRDENSYFWQVFDDNSV